MTRVNVVPVDELTNQHLMAEWREIPHMPKALARTLKSKAGFKPEKVADEYLLNTGHVYFFYNKLRFLEKRLRQIQCELLERGYNIDGQRRVKFDGFNPKFYNDYEPTPEARKINRERIYERLWARPHLYKYWNTPFTVAVENIGALICYRRKDDRDKAG